jgi:hypothetical protein
MILHSSGADRFRDLTADDAYRSWLISRNQPPIVYHSGTMQWKRLRVVARQIVGFLASRRVALAADKARRARYQPAFGRLGDKPETRTVDRSRP